MRIVCCRCDADLGENPGEGVTHTYCDRCAKVAGLEIELEQAEGGKWRAERSLRAEKFEKSHEIAIMNCESEVELWTDRVREIEIKISDLKA